MTTKQIDYCIELLKIIIAEGDSDIKNKMSLFLNIKRDNILDYNLEVKNRTLSPLVLKRRIQLFKQFEYYEIKKILQFACVLLDKQKLDYYL